MKKLEMNFKISLLYYPLYKYIFMVIFINILQAAFYGDSGSRKSA